MNGVLFLAIAVAIASIWGAAFLLRIWHEDRDDLQAAHVKDPKANPPVRFLRTWPFSRVLAYVAVLACLASNTVGLPLILRLIEFPNFREIGLALTPFTITSLLWLDVAFVVIAIYLRIVRSRP